MKSLPFNIAKKIIRTLRYDDANAGHELNCIYLIFMDCVYALDRSLYMLVLLAKSF